MRKSRRPFDGRLVVSSPPVIGQRVTQGEVLAELLPLTSVPSDLAGLELAREEATATLELATQGSRTRRTSGDGRRGARQAP